MGSSLALFLAPKYSTPSVKQAKWLCTSYFPLLREIFNGVWGKEATWCISTRIEPRHGENIALGMSLSILSVFGKCPFVFKSFRFRKRLLLNPSLSLHSCSARPHECWASARWKSQPTWLEGHEREEVPPHGTRGSLQISRRHYCSAVHLQDKWAEPFSNHKHFKGLEIGIIEIIESSCNRN